MDRTVTLKEGLKNKSFSEKIDYLWTYYKLHIIAIISILFLLFTLIFDELNKKVPYCTIKYIDNSVSGQELSDAADKLNDIVLHNDKHSIINFDSHFDMVYISTKQVDIAIVSKEFFDQNFSSNMFLDLDSLNGFSDLPIKNHKLIKKADDSGKNGTYGIEIKDLNILKDIHSDSDDKILTVISNTEHNDAVINLLKVFLE